MGSDSKEREVTAFEFRIGKETPGRFYRTAATDFGLGFIKRIG